MPDFSWSASCLEIHECFHVWDCHSFFLIAARSQTRVPTCSLPIPRCVLQISSTHYSCLLMLQMWRLGEEDLRSFSNCCPEPTFKSVLS